MRKISIIFSIVLIVNICFCVQSHCYAKIFSNSRSIIELWYPDNFYPVKPVISNTIGAFTDGKTGSLIISGIEYPQLKNFTKTDEIYYLKNALDRMIETKEQLHNKDIKYQLIDVSNTHKAMILYITTDLLGKVDHTINVVGMIHGQQIIITFTNYKYDNYDMQLIWKTINSIQCRICQ